MRSSFAFLTSPSAFNASVSSAISFRTFLHRFAALFVFAKSGLSLNHNQARSGIRLELGDQQETPNQLTASLNFVSASAVIANNIS
jgi:hypothetical protein